MTTWRTTVACTLSALAAVVTVRARAEAQAFHYPALQLPTVSTRDYTTAVASGAGTTVLLQWREGMSARRHWELDAGVADRRGSESLTLFVGGGLAQTLATATGDQPLDVLLAAGAGASFGGGSTLFRVPVGVSVGHTFALEQGMSLTPFVHPRASLDVCGSCGADRSGDSEVSLNFDLGANFQVNRQFAVRASAGFSGSDVAGGQDTFAVGFTWTPATLARRAPR
jgi:hypothetical protein